MVLKNKDPRYKKNKSAFKIFFHIKGKMNKYEER